MNEPLGQGGALAMGHHPADDVPAEDVEHDVEVEVGPLRRVWAQINIVPTPMTTPTKLLSQRTFNQIAMVFSSGALAPY
jgi:hypothetical protein